MLRGNGVGSRHRFIHISGYNYFALIRKCGPADPFPGQQRHLACQLLFNGVGQIGAGRHQYRGGHFVVLGLGQQIGGQPDRVGAFVGKDKDFRRAGHHVDIHLAEHLPLGLRHKNVSRPGDLADLGHALRAVSQGGDGLCSARLDHRRHARDPRRGQNEGVHRPVLPGRRGQNDFRHSGHLGRNNVHQDAGRIAGRSAGDIDAHPRQRRNPLPQHNAVLTEHDEAPVKLPLMESPDILRGPFHHVQQPGGHGRLRPLPVRDQQGRQHRAVKLRRKGLQGRVLVFPDVRDDARHDRLHIRRGGLIPGQDLVYADPAQLVSFDHFAASISFCVISSVSPRLNR